MNAPDIIDELAARADQESIPFVSVADEVIDRIDSVRRKRRRIIPLSMFAAASAVAAAVILVIGLYFTTQEAVDPMLQLVAPVEDVQLW
jgi:nitrate/nitrite-specific signal transduction histidine kinase